MSYSQERKQQFLNNFIERVNGKGRAIREDGSCTYIKSDHPGCAIGCQPEFQAACRKLTQEQLTILEGYNGSIFGLIGYSNGFAGQTIREAFELTSPTLAHNEVRNLDLAFLYALQGLHDLPDHWKDNRLKQTTVKEFCEFHELTVPDSVYA